MTFADYLPIEEHALIGDRRTGALVATDGRIDWFCAPDFDDDVIFGALLDAPGGGFFHLGPERPLRGAQRYVQRSARLVTHWRGDDFELELSDFMPWPERERPHASDEEARIIVRRLHVLKGKVAAHLRLRPHCTFAPAEALHRCDGGACFTLGERQFGFWTSRAFELHDHTAASRFGLVEGDEVWAAFGLGLDPTGCDAERCRQWQRETDAYWRDWTAHLRPAERFGSALQRCAITVHLLTHAPNDAVVAAATTSLPERVGGDRNYDYRYTWVRDASIAAAFLAKMGASSGVAHYFDWLSGLDSKVDAPLQVCYRTDGQTGLDERIVDVAHGWRGSRPVRFGNRAHAQRQIGSLGWFADSALTFLDAGGEWKAPYWALLRRCADYACSAWHESDSGVWELTVQAHYVASKVMAWVTIDRALQVAKRLGETASAHWVEARARIHADVLRRGWSESRRSFRQRYEAEALDAATLLIPLMGFLPACDPRVLASLDAIESDLVVDGLVHRFDPAATLGGTQPALADFEGAFLPATFWYAQALAHAGRRAAAEAIVRRCEAIAGGPGLFAEEADARTHAFLGNTPLLFSQVAYARALLALDRQPTLFERKPSP